MPENSPGPTDPTEPEGPTEPTASAEPEEYEVSFTVAGWAGGQPTFVEGPIPTAEGRELWTLTVGFFAHDPVHAITMAQHATRRIAKVFPRFNKDMVQVLRQNSYDEPVLLYCDLDIYCVQPPHHTGPCRSQDGRNLDEYDTETDPAPEFGADI